MRKARISHMLPPWAISLQNKIPPPFATNQSLQVTVNFPCSAPTSSDSTTDQNLKYSRSVWYISLLSASMAPSSQLLVSLACLQGYYTEMMPWIRCRRSVHWSNDVRRRQRIRRLKWFCHSLYPNMQLHGFIIRDVWLQLRFIGGPLRNHLDITSTIDNCSFRLIGGSLRNT